MKPEILPEAESLVRRALSEDIGSGDITSSLLIPESAAGTARIIAKEPCIVAGLPFAGMVFEMLDPSVRFREVSKEGSRVKKGAVLASIKGNLRCLLAGERTALNLLQRMSGIATMTRRFVDAVKGTGAVVTDTRKTAPGLRAFDKYAVRIGGGRNHRFGLYDGIIIKENHIKAAGGISKAVGIARKRAGHLMKVEVEAETMREVKAAVRAGADIIMLDNMPPERLKKAVEFIREASPSTLIEASGGIDLSNIRAVAETGVDLISSGALTHSVRAADLSMLFD